MITQNRFQWSCLALLAMFLLPSVFLNSDDTRPLEYTRFPHRFDNEHPIATDQRLLLRFNQEVDAEKVANYFHFVNASDKEREELKIKVTSLRPSLEEIKNFGKNLIKEDITPEQLTGQQNHFVLVAPLSPLVQGHKWFLSSEAGLSNFANTHLLKTSHGDFLGTLAPFAINSVSAINPYDQDKTLLIEHNKFRLAPEFDATTLAQFIDITPKPENFTIEAENHGIRLHGKFDYDTNYEVVVKPSLMGNDKTTLLKEVTKSVTFQPNPGFIRLPMFSATQNASGHRSFAVETANLKHIRTRVKGLKGDILISTLKGYKEGYSGDGNKQTIPFSIVPGKTIYDQTRERKAGYDITESFQTNWNEINPASEFGAYYVCAEGVSDTSSENTLGAHALVQVTDIGLAWKQSESKTLIYAFSIKTGSSKAGIPIRLVNDEGEEMASSPTNGEGIASFSSEQYKDKSLWLDASSGADRHVMAFTSRLDRVGLWNFDIPVRYSDSENEEQRTHIFTDRDVYKPGEKVYLKCITRTADTDRLLPAKPVSAKFRVTDGEGRKLIDKTVTFSSRGSYHEEITIPELSLGYHSITMDFSDPEKEEDYDQVSYHSFNVAEYRVNTFEVSMDSKNVMTSDAVSIPLSAKYYMGKPLTKALVTWNAYANNQFPDPEGFAEFNFGDTSYDESGFSEDGKLQLGENGEARLDLNIPIDEKIPAPRQVFLRAEVTDVNQQTISESTSFTIHSSDFYIGLRKPEGIHRAGDKVPFNIANIDTNGKIYDKPVNTTITVEKEIWTIVKVKGSDGKITHRNERQLELKKRETVTTQSRLETASLAFSQAHPITFDEAGDYIITLEAIDASGRKILTRENFRIIGADEPTWAWNDVVAIDVVPDRKSYKVGDTAKILVRSAVFGKALVTTERGDVKTTKVVEISQPETVIDIPIDERAAPNLFASVLIIRGSEASPHKHPTADYRLGYCQLNVEDPGNELKVTLENGSAKFFAPGQSIEVSALVTDAAGKGVPEAEVTIYAVDEGNLSLTDYQTPDPGEVFDAPFPLCVRVGQSLSDLVPENPLEREFGNKGFVIGGGGMSDDPVGKMNKVRKNFQTLAFWKPDLITDASGRVTFTFTAPDNLTTFRLMAVVAKDNRFGSADKSMVISKPLMIEPALPSFSNLGDQIDLTAVLHNNTEIEQHLEIAVELDQHAMFVEKLGQTLPTNLSTLGADKTLRTENLTILAGQTEVLHFPAAMLKNGEAKWKWKVHSKTDPALLDMTESTLPIGFPLPLLKTSKSLTVKEAGDAGNLLAEVNPRFLDGTGTITVTLSNSRMVDATEALDYLLEYPYGCVEQTTSTTIPWLSTSNMRKALPSLNISEAEVEKAIKKGTTRLLSMQTHDGGLGYWPGDNRSLLSGSAYGGLALATAHKQGVALPQDRLDHLWKYLANQLRDSAGLTDAYRLSERCLALYTLAKAGQPEASYLDVLYNKREHLPAEARSLLALAMVESNPDPAVVDPRVEVLLSAQPTNKVSEFSWYQKPYFKATELMAWSKFKPNDARTDQILTELIDLRQQGRGWGSTYSNAWPLMALAAHSEATSAALSQNEVTLQFGDRIEKVPFDGTLASQTFQFRFDSDITKTPLKLQVQHPARIYASVKVATQPKVLAMQPENQGFAIERTYQKLEQDGSLHPTENLMVGDLVLVKIDFDLPNAKEEYLAIDDALPSILEAINPSFKSQETQSVVTDKDDGKKINYLYTSHRELRKDRTLFFADYVHSSGKHRIQYLARVIAAGDCIAPPAKIEAMYTPERYGLSGTQMLSARTLLLKENKVAQR